MLLHRIVVRNIRSYEDAMIEFAEGITLLSGDIGAGKSTILHAIEFALFGTLRGALNGEALLRHGADSGEVALTFELDTVLYTVTRNLRRGAQGVRQTDCSLETAGILEELSSQELKARILALLGYPEQLLTKSKGLIFRHTVYTPQEEMKHILFMEPEDRLNTLRMLFGIERYRTIKENAQLVLRELRSRERLLREQSARVPELERHHKETADRLAAASAASAAQKTLSQEAAASVHDIRKRSMDVRLRWEAAQANEQKRQALTAAVRELERSERNTREDIHRIDEFLAVALESVDDHTAALDALRKNMDALDAEILARAREAASLAGRKELVQQQAQKVTTMDNCPLCQQSVGEGHKQHVHTHAATTMAEIDARIATLRREEEALRGKRAAAQNEFTKASEQQRRFAAYQKEVLARREQERTKVRLLARQSELGAERTRQEEALRSLPARDPALESQYAAIHAELEAAEKVMQSRLAELTSAREAESAAHTEHAVLARQLLEARQSQAEMARLQTLRQWLEDGFLELISTIESHVLASVHTEFHDLFSSWFARMIEDESMQASLGHGFEPLISQNGYDSSLEQLSGGEKTAVALSYRLSLYKVVSDFVNSVRTKDLLILDEPTDGFSREQLDRVRDVLRSLGCRQIILVSHESQMESGCDHVIRVEKRLHRSATS